MINSEKRAKGYQRSYAKYGASPKGLQWRSKEAAEARYKTIVESADFSGKSVLDVGCGFGDLFSFIKKKTSHFSYTGVDMVPEFINEAQKRYPRARFIKEDYFTNPLNEDFDIIVCNGALNANLGTDEENLLFRKKAIKTMFDHARKILVFNMAGMYPLKRPALGRVWWANPAEIIEYCLSLTPELVFESGYKPKEFLLKLNRRPSVL